MIEDTGSTEEREKIVAWRLEIVKHINKMSTNFFGKLRQLRQQLES
jgi:hypothetical protein